MYCSECRKYRGGTADYRFCKVCGAGLSKPAREQVEADLSRLEFLVVELERWTASGLMDERQRAVLSPPYEHEIAIVRALLEGRPVVTPEVKIAAAAPVAEPAAAQIVVVEPIAEAPIAAAAVIEAPPPALLVEPALLIAAESPSPAPEALAAGGAVALVIAPEEPQPVLELPDLPPRIVPRAADVSPRPRTVAAHPEVIPDLRRSVRKPKPRPAAKPAAPAIGERLAKELRPVFFENLLLLLGGFLVFAGSVYFAIYFWNRLGDLGPLVAGGLLATYAIGFAGAGYLLQRRYHADLSARVLYGIAVLILPVAQTLLGEPIRHGGLHAIAAATAVTVLAAGAYPLVMVAASLFQREVGAPFARSFVALLFLIGLAPLAHFLPHPLAIAILYLSAVPLLQLHLRVRGIGRVFERATVVFVVGGAA